MADEVAAGTNENLIEVRGLTKHFPVRKGIFLSTVTGAVQAVDDVSFDLKRGEILGLVGESGSGKTTTGRLMVRLLEATAGDVKFEGKSAVRAFDLMLHNDKNTPPFPVLQPPIIAIAGSVSTDESDEDADVGLFDRKG